MLVALSEATIGAGPVAAGPVPVVGCLIAVPFERAVPYFMFTVTLMSFFDGRSIGFDQPAAQTPWLRLCHDREEPARGWLDALQKLVRAMRSSARTVPVAWPNPSRVSNVDINFTQH